ncbi:MAG: 3-deoxy-D-manno-octulosonic acid transferase [Chthoniobacterales bacterium]
MTMLLYNLLWPVGLLVFMPGFLLKMFRRGGYRKNFSQRLGFYSAEIRQRLRNQRPVWMHAVSVGEVMIALKLARQLRALRPDMHCALTTTTTTGYALAQRSAPEWMTVLYTPLDFLPIMRNAFGAISPRQIVLTEAEVWPNLVSEAHRRKIPVAVANARLSPRSERKFLRFRFVLGQIFGKLNLLCVPEPADAERWRCIGAQQDRIRVVGNIKFDPEERHTASFDPCRFLEQIGTDPARLILLGGSTHRGEEAILLDAFIELREEFTGLFLIIAPRHAERAGEIESLLRARGLRAARRSRAGETSPEVLLIDTTGELADWYRVATVVFIGKSMTARGGQNPVEALVAGKPVIFGPHMENFAALSRQLLEQRGAVCARNVNELIASARELLRDAELREALVARASSVLAQHRDATARTAELISALG